MLGKGRLIRWIVEKKAAINKQAFVQNIQQKIAFLNENIVEKVDLELCSFCGKKSMADQLLSISSFYSNVGKPKLWTIYSDGTLLKEDIDLLQSIHEISVEAFILKDEDIYFEKYVHQYPTAKKIFILKHLRLTNTVVFADSDIIFYPLFKNYLLSFKKGNWYITDTGNGYFDKEYVEQNPNGVNPLNLGMMVLNIEPDWSIVTNYLIKKWEERTMHYWSDQTACNILAKHDANFQHLSDAVFPTGGNDAFSFKNAFDETKIAIRHFCGPVRHKMWQKNWRKILK